MTSECDTDTPVCGMSVAIDRMARCELRRRNLSRIGAPRPRTGGTIVVGNVPRAQLDEILRQDPFGRAGARPTK